MRLPAMLRMESEQDDASLPVRHRHRCCLARQFVRAIECINRHIYVHTHYARYSESRTAIAFAEETGWIPPDTTEVYGWDDIPQLARDYSAGTITSYFPLFQVNAH